MDDTLLETLYNNAKEGHPYQLYTITRANLLAVIDRLRAAEKASKLTQDRLQDAYNAGVNAGSRQC